MQVEDRHGKVFFAVKRSVECDVYTMPADEREPCFAPTGKKRFRRFEVYEATSYGKFRDNYEVCLGVQKCVSIPIAVFISEDELLSPFGGGEQCTQ